MTQTDFFTSLYSKTFWGLTTVIERKGSLPLDAFSIFNSKAAATVYASMDLPSIQAYNAEHNTSIPNIGYPGQIITVRDASDQISFHYIGANGTLEDLIPENSGSSELPQSVLIFKGSATAISDDTKTLTVDGNLIVASEANKGYVYILTGTGKEYVSVGDHWELFGVDVAFDTSNLVDKTTFEGLKSTVTQQGNTIGGLSGSITALQTKDTELNNTIVAVKDHVGTDIDKDNNGLPDDEYWVEKSTDANTQEEAKRALTLTERVNKLKAKFSSYYTARETDTAISTAITASYSTSAFKTAVANTIVWEDLSNEAVTPTSLPTEF